MHAERRRSEPRTITDLQTPCLLLDAARMDRNIAWLKGRLHGLGVGLRPHLKTSKCPEVAQRLVDGAHGATVSTLLEAEQFAAAGFNDLIYAVGIAPGKLQRALALRRQGVNLKVLLDSPEQARAVVDAARDAGLVLPALIEIDCDGHRSGVRPGDPQLLEIGRILAEIDGGLAGVLTHAGDSYNHPDAERLRQIAELERSSAVACANTLRAAGLPCGIVSVGSTPTAHFGRRFDGVTEVRAGVFVFFDLVMAGLGVCQVDDIAVSVLSSVIGHQRDTGRIVIDAGWMAMSRDRGTAKQSVDQGYGLACDVTGRPYDDLILLDANQEHGLLGLRAAATSTLPDLPVGSLVRILPNHACATAAQHAYYEVMMGNPAKPRACWPRFSGW